MPGRGGKLGRTLGKLASSVGARSAPADPWACEATLLTTYTRLGAACESQRVVLLENVERLRQVEEQRVQLVQEAFSLFLERYKDVLPPMLSDVGEVSSLASAIDSGAELASIEGAVQQSQTVGKAFVEKRQTAVEAAQLELLSSPEIVRQGALACLEVSTQSWEECHTVLTRAGRLYWFPSAVQLYDVASVNLARCQFDDGDAPSFNLVEHALPAKAIFTGSKSRRVVNFRAASVEECCEWAIALREAIAAAARH